MAYGYIYGIYDVGDPARIRYVGQTTKTIRARYMDHWHTLSATQRGKRKPTALTCWLGKRPRSQVGVTEISRHDSQAELDRAEIDLIASFRASGMADLNIAAGGGIGPLSERTKKLLREANAGENSLVSKLTWAKVSELRNAYISGVEVKDIAEMAPEIGSAQLTRILRNRRWVDENYVPPPPRTTAKINMAIAKEMRNRRVEGFIPRREMAEEYGVSVVLVDKVLKNELWTDPEFDRSTLAPSNRDHVPRRQPRSVPLE